jgi:hypothetical protein
MFKARTREQPANAEGNKPDILDANEIYIC